MTAQEMFDKVWQYFITDKNKPGRNTATGNCVYLAKDKDTGAELRRRLPSPITGKSAVD